MRRAAQSGHGVDDEASSKSKELILFFLKFKVTFRYVVSSSPA